MSATYTEDEKRIADEFAQAHGRKPEEVPDWLRDTMCFLVRKAREDEPRINCGLHMADYSLMEEHDDFDSFYGPDYFDPAPPPLAQLTQQ